MLEPPIAEGEIQAVDHAVDGAGVVHVLQGGWVALSEIESGLTMDMEAEEGGGVSCFYSRTMGQLL